MNLEHPRSKLDVPLVDLIERFVRHYNRRHETPVVASLLGVSDASGELDPRVAVGNLWDPVVAATLELQLRRQQPRPPPPPVEPPTDDERKAGVMVLSGYDLPPANGLVFDKTEFDNILAGIGEQLLVVLFEKTDSERSAKAAEGYRGLAKKFWPKALLLRADVDDNKDLAVACGVKVAPSYVFFRNGRQTDRLVGGDELQLNVKICKWLHQPEKQVAKTDDWGQGLLGRRR